MFLGQVFLIFIFIFYGEPILKVHGSFPVTHLFLYDTQPVLEKVGLTFAPQLSGVG